VQAAAVIWLVGLGAINVALAAPERSHAEFQFIGRPLDLRPPARVIESLQKVPMTFPSASRRPLSQEQLQAGLGSEAFKTRSRAEQIVRRVHKEGVPVARLFENKSTLVDVGLSPRGKPGLWFFHSMH
jgi:hypothetical protein